jgi:hypothetical protein
MTMEKRRRKRIRAEAKGPEDMNLTGPKFLRGTEAIPKRTIKTPRRRFQGEERADRSMGPRKKEETKPPAERPPTMRRESPKREKKGLWAWGEEEEERGEEEREGAEREEAEREEADSWFSPAGVSPAGVSLAEVSLGAAFSSVVSVI